MKMKLIIDKPRLVGKPPGVNKARLPRYVTALASLRPAGEPDDRDQSKLEEKLWDPECPLTNKQIDQFLVVAR